MFAMGRDPSLAPCRKSDIRAGRRDRTSPRSVRVVLQSLTAVRDIDTAAFMFAPTIATVEYEVEDRDSRENHKCEKGCLALRLSRQNAVADEKPGWAAKQE